MAEQIVDACCVINLFASGRLVDILRSCGGMFHVSKQVRAESLLIRQPDPASPDALIDHPVDLEAAEKDGVLLRCELQGEEEAAAFISFAQLVDDGEASCLAIAKCRGWTVATDDRKAIRLATQEQIAVVTTPELLDRWARAAGPSARELAIAIASIERFARFRPRAKSPLRDWWVKAISKSE